MFCCFFFVYASTVLVTHHDALATANLTGAGLVARPAARTPARVTQAVRFHARLSIWCLFQLGYTPDWRM